MYKYNKFHDDEGIDDAIFTQYYSEPIYIAENTDVVYENGTNPVPDFIYDNNGNMVFELNII